MNNNGHKQYEARLVYSTSRAEAEDYEPALVYSTSAGLAQDACSPGEVHLIVTSSWSRVPIGCTVTRVTQVAEYPHIA